MAKSTQDLLSKAQALNEAIETLSKPKPIPLKDKPNIPSFADKNFSKALEQSKPENKPSTFRFGERSLWEQKEESLITELVAFVEKFYISYKKLPEEADFDTYFPEEMRPRNVPDFYVQIKDELLKRGIRPYSTPLEYLEPRFVLAVNLMCDPYDRREVAAKLKDAGLTTRTWKNFLVQEKYNNFYRKAVENIFSEQAQEIAKQGLIKLLGAGDLQAIKYFEERQDIYRPQQTQAFEIINKVLVALMEILGRHLTSEKLNLVAQEFNQVIEATVRSNK